MASPFLAGPLAQRQRFRCASCAHPSPLKGRQRQRVAGGLVDYVCATCVAARAAMAPARQH